MIRVHARLYNENIHDRCLHNIDLPSNLHNLWPKFYSIDFFKKMGQPRPLFRLFSVFSNKHYNFYNNNMWKMSI